MKNSYFFIPKEIMDRVPKTVKDAQILLTLVKAYRALKKGDDVGLITYYINPNGEAVLNADNYDTNLKELYKKCATVNLCTSSLISLDILPMRPKDIAKTLYEELIAHGIYGNKIPHSDCVETVKVIVGYKTAPRFTRMEKLMNELRHSVIITDKKH